VIELKGDTEQRQLITSQQRTAKRIVDSFLSRGRIMLGDPLPTGEGGVGHGPRAPRVRTYPTPHSMSSRILSSPVNLSPVNLRLHNVWVPSAVLVDEYPVKVLFLFILFQGRV
jgi:hypothetical protein